MFRNKCCIISAVDIVFFINIISSIWKFKYCTSVKLVSESASYDYFHMRCLLLLFCVKLHCCVFAVSYIIHVFMQFFGVFPEIPHPQFSCVRQQQRKILCYSIKKIVFSSGVSLLHSSVPFVNYQTDIDDPAMCHGRGRCISHCSAGTRINVTLESTLHPLLAHSLQLIGHLKCKCW